VEWEERRKGETGESYMRNEMEKIQQGEKRKMKIKRKKNTIKQRD
jgi:hypothetical protein